MIAPLTGQVTEAVANSPTAPLSGVHSDTNTVAVYAGFVADVVEPFGFTTTVVVFPSNG